MTILGTAGHIDHGKSALVKALTGQNPDRLLEEKRRGMTIDLGFASLDLPSGRRISLIDVPGHERFIKNMLAGAGGIQVAMLVVAADEGIMPQTREHLDILHLLDIRNGIVVLSKADLVEEEWLEMVGEEVLALLQGTRLEGSPVVVASAVTGAGIGELVQTLDAVTSQVSPEEQWGMPHLGVDRSFSLAGFGTVVTGTLLGGALDVGQTVQVLPRGRKARIRGLQTHGQSVERARAGTRVALNLTGVRVAEVPRGTEVVPEGSAPLATRADVWLRALPSSPPLIDGFEAAVHVGAGEYLGRVRPLDRPVITPGTAGWVRLRFSEALPLFPGQRFVLRLPSPARTVAGGTIVDVGPSRQRFGPLVRQRLEGLASTRLKERVVAALPARAPATIEELAGTMGALPRQVGAVLDGVDTAPLSRLGNYYVGENAWGWFGERAAALLAAYHAAHPLEKGMPVEELRQRVGWPSDALISALRRLDAEGVVRLEERTVALSDHHGGSELQEDEARVALQALLAKPFSPPTLRELVDAGVSETMLAALAREGRVVRVEGNLYFAREAFEEMVERTMRLISRNGSVTVAQIRDDLDTSRRYALAFLEHLDGKRFTRRDGETRVAGNRTPTCV